MVTLEAGLCVTKSRSVYIVTGFLWLQERLFVSDWVTFR